MEFLVAPDFPAPEPVDVELVFEDWFFSEDPADPLPSQPIPVHGFFPSQFHPTHPLFIPADPVHPAAQPDCGLASRVKVQRTTAATTQKSLDSPLGNREK
ncbi:MAG: hypothetical protein HYY46_04105 [Deltaproteobacteria bacterium]|nr:hypothetical protein [Deltaproteobacteria bacterium]